MTTATPRKTAVEKRVEKWTRSVSAALEGLGFEYADYAYGRVWRLDTPAGTLEMHPSGDSTVFGLFLDHVKARRLHMPCGPTGKWNFHFEQKTPPAERLTELARSITAVKVLS